MAVDQFKLRFFLQRLIRDVYQHQNGCGYLWSKPQKEENCTCYVKEKLRLLDNEITDMTWDENYCRTCVKPIIRGFAAMLEESHRMCKCVR